MQADVLAFERVQQGVRVVRVDLDVRLSVDDTVAGDAEISYETPTPVTRFLLDPRLRIGEVSVDGVRTKWTRAGPLVQVKTSEGTHRLGTHWNGPLPSNGDLGISGSSFDLNLNLLWYPVLVFGSRFEARLRIRLPRGAEAVLPSVAHGPRRAASMSSVLDVPVVGGRIRGSSRGRGVSVYSLVRHDVAEVRRRVERVVEWLEGKWGPRPFRPLRLVETWRAKHGAYAREGLIVTPDWRALPESEATQRLVHEATHQWWGMDVLPGEGWFSEDWLSEGLATFSEYLWVRETEGGDAADRFRRNAAKNVHGMQGALSSQSPWTQEGWHLSRSGAALVLADLEERIPDLVEVLRQYRARHHGSFVTTKTLLRELKEHIGESWLNEHLTETRTWPGDLGESRRSPGVSRP